MIGGMIARPGGSKDAGVPVKNTRISRLVSNTNRRGKKPSEKGSYGVHRRKLLAQTF